MTTRHDNRDARVSETRAEREAREADARNKSDGWAGEFVAWIPMAIITTVLCALMMYGMLAIEQGGFNDLF